MSFGQNKDVHTVVYATLKQTSGFAEIICVLLEASVEAGSKDSMVAVLMVCGLLKRSAVIRANYRVREGLRIQPVP